MAGARRLTKEISYDERLWGLSPLARTLFFCLIPHTETNGSVPRNAKILRLRCFPLAKITDQDTESFILEWLATTPPIAIEATIEGQSRLVLTDFEKCNRNLPIFKMRRHRQLNHVTNVTNVTNVTKKRPASVAETTKVKRTAHEVGALKAVVGRYLELTGKGTSEIAQNQAMWGRWMLEADKLLLELQGRQDLALECMDDLSKRWATLTDWTISGVTRRALDWLAQRQSEVSQNRGR